MIDPEELHLVEKIIAQHESLEQLLADFKKSA